MKVFAVTCTECSGPLEVPARTEFVTCTFCGSRLRVQRSGNALSTELLDDIDDRTRRIAEDVETIRLDQELEELDREWTMDRERFRVRGPDEQYDVPSVAGAMFAIGVAVVFGIVWIVAATSMGAPTLFPLFGALFIAFGIATGARSLAKANEHGRRRREYEAKRRQLTARRRDAAGR